MTDTTKPASSQTNRLNTFQSLKSRDFKFLWLGIIFMMAGMQMQSIARGYLVYDITSSALLLGLVNVGFAVPMLILSLFGGVAADRINRKRLIQLCQALAAGASLAIAVSISLEVVTWVHLFIASSLHGIVFAFLVPARQALIPQLVDRDLLTNALALNAAAFSLMILLAPAFAGFLYSIIGPAGVYYVVTAMEIVAVVCTGLIRYKKNDIKKIKIFSEIREGLSYILKNPLVIILIVIGLSFSLLVMPIRMLMPIFIVDIYHRGPDALGLLFSAMGLGALVGSLVIASMGKWKRGLILLSGGIISGVSLILLAVIPVYAAAAAILLFVGVGDSIRRSLNQALILEITEKQYQGRVISVYAMNFGFIPLGVLPASAIAEFFGVGAASATLGFVLIIVCFIILLTRKELRKII
jgi:MFS family permease